MVKIEITHCPGFIKSIGKTIRSTEFLLSAALVLSLKVLASCSPAPEYIGEETETEETQDPIPTIQTCVSVRAAELPATMDVLVYSATGVRELESYIHIDEVYQLFSLDLTAGSKIIAAIGNCPSKLNPKALERYDSLQQLMYDFRDFDPLRPVTSAVLDINAGDDVCLGLAPLCSSVVITEVSNELPDYQLAESPRVYLTDINPYSGYFQFDEFRPTETIDSGVIAELPYDIGFYTQYPWTVLYCLPNDTPEKSLSSPHTAVVFECEIGGELCTGAADLPPFGRDAVIEVSVLIDTQGNIMLTPSLV